MFELASPYYLFLLPLLVVAAWRLFRRGVRAGLSLPTVSHARAPSATWRTRLARVLPVIYLVGMALLIVALARPRAVLAEIRRSADAVAMLMAVDISGSMEALDLSERTPTGIRTRTRLDVVKTTFADFVARRPDDLIGLVTFGGYAVTRVPLTSDHAALLHVLNGVEIPNERVVDGRLVNQEELLTAIGDALAMGAARLREVEPVSRIVVLLSDGESNTGVVRPDDAIRVCKELGIKVYTIGIGAPGTARTPFLGRDVFGRDAIQYAEITMDEAMLRRIAEATGGRYFNVRDPRGLDAAVTEIDAMETTRIERDEYRQYDERFPWFLYPGGALLALAVSLNILATRRLL